MTTQIHDSTTCTAGVNGQQCDMCRFAQNARRTDSGLFRAEQGQKIDSSPSSGSGIDLPAPTPTPDFTREWETAPRWATRTTERESAEWWLLRGRRLERQALLAAQNQDLQEILRVARERITR